jgi:outer membrane autotransporter protein
VEGKTTISNQATVQVTALDPQTSYQTGQVYRIINSAGGIDGQFASAISKSAFLDVALNYSANAVDLSIAQKESGENPGNPGGENPGNPGGENPGIRAVRIPVIPAVKIRGIRAARIPVIQARATPARAHRVSSRQWR